MGQQQLLLIILGVIIVGVAIAVGISMFSGQSVASNKDAIITDIATLGADVYQYKIRPTSMGGGNGSYTGYTLSSTGAWGTNNPNATYSVTLSASSAVILGTSKQVASSSVTVTVDGNGKAGTPVVTGF